jgi:serpin B
MSRKSYVFCSMGFAAWLAAGAGLSAAAPRAAEPADGLRGVVEGNNAFALDLYSKLQTSKGNLFFSPYSISSAFAMTYAGASGKTAAEMAKVLHYDLPGEKLHAGFSGLLADLSGRTLASRWTDDPDAGKKSFELEIANSLWGQRGYSFQEAFLAIARKHHGAGFKEVDFGKDPEAARKLINAWVEQKTMERIKDLIAEGQVTDLTRLVLASAIYFKSSWEHPFDEGATKDAPFHLASGKSIPVPTMHQTDVFPCMEEKTFRGIELPYKGKDLSMLVLVPKEADGLPALERSLNTGKLAAWRAFMKRQDVGLALPKFSFSAKLDLKDTLISMGMKDAFNDKAADFSGMTGEPDLFIAFAVHKAFIAVDEKGTEAAAATAVGMALRGPPPKPLPFRVDRPFLFLIRDNRTGSILFLGRVLDPRSGES